MPVNLPNFLISSDICMASSRVGASTKPCMPRPCFVFCSIDMPNAAVLPEPVWAWPTTSLPESSTGMVASCMGNVSSKPIFTRAFSMGASTPSASNVAVPFSPVLQRQKPLRFPPLFLRPGPWRPLINCGCGRGRDLRQPGLRQIGSRSAASDRKRRAA